MRRSAPRCARVEGGPAGISAVTARALSRSPVHFSSSRFSAPSSCSERIVPLLRVRGSHTASCGPSL